MRGRGGTARIALNVADEYRTGHSVFLKDDNWYCGQSFDQYLSLQQVMVITVPPS